MRAQFGAFANGGDPGVELGGKLRPRCGGKAGADGRRAEEKLCEFAEREQFGKVRGRSGAAEPRAQFCGGARCGGGAGADREKFLARFVGPPGRPLGRVDGRERMAADFAEEFGTLCELAGGVAATIELAGLAGQHVGPAELDDGQVAAGKEKVEALVRAEAARIAVMQRAHVGVQLVAGALQFVGALLPGFGRLLRGEIEGFLELAQHLALAGFVGVKFEAERREALLLQAAMHDVERGAFFGDEQDATAVGEAVRDDVRDCLRFAGAGRAFEDEVVAVGGGDHGGELGGVGAARAVDFGRRKTIVEFARVDVFGRIAVGEVGVVHHVANDAVAREIVEAVGEIFPEQEFRERKLSEPDFGLHFPAGKIAHCGAEDAGTPGRRRRRWRLRAADRVRRFLF